MSASLVAYPSPAAALAAQASQSGVQASDVVVTETSVAISSVTEVIPSTEAHEIIGRSTGIQGQTFLFAGEAWTWEQMRDYVVGQIESKWGARPRDPLKESGIFKGFISRWGDRAPAIAKAAFEVYNGVWNGAPVSVERFSKGSDPYFAEVLSKNL